MAIAEFDGVFELDGDAFWIRAGEEYPDAASWREAEQPVTAAYPGPQEGIAVAAPPEEE